MKEFNVKHLTFDQLLETNPAMRQRLLNMPMSELKKFKKEWNGAATEADRETEIRIIKERLNQ